MIEPQIITQPTVLAVTAFDAKEHLRITHDHEDTLLELYAEAACSTFEQLTGRTLHETEYQIAMDRFPPSPCAIVLPMAVPLLSVTSIIYRDSDGVSTTWNSANYVVDTDSLPGRIAPAYGQSYPSFTPYPLGAVKIRYKAGIPNTSTPSGPMHRRAPAVFRRAILEMIGSAYENREAETVTDKATIRAEMLTYGARCVLQNWRIG